MSGISRDERRYSDDDIANIARSVEAHDFERIDPPAMVWNNILAEVEVAMASEEATARRRARRWISSPRLLSAAAVALLMVGVAVAVVTSGDEDRPVTELASAVMTDEGLPVATAETAEARVVCEEQGSEQTCFVEVELTDLPDAGSADLELWVINDDVTDMHSLGLVTDSGTFPLPSGVGPDDFPIVDISVEPRDGEPAHSGQSVLRGVLEA